MFKSAVINEITALTRIGAYFENMVLIGKGHVH